MVVVEKIENMGLRAVFIKVFGILLAITTYGQEKVLGLYASYSFDGSGFCDGFCWDYYYFLPDYKLIKTFHFNSIEDISCNNPPPKKTCRSYNIENGMLMVDGIKPKKFLKTGPNALKIGNAAYFRVVPTKTTWLEGTYAAQSAVKINQGNTVVTQHQLVFKKDGTINITGITDLFSDDKTSSQNRGVTISGNKKFAHSGSYSISGNTIQITDAKGNSKEHLFFIVENGENIAMPNMVHIGKKDYYLIK